MQDARDYFDNYESYDDYDTYDDYDVYDDYDYDDFYNSYNNYETTGNNSLYEISDSGLSFSVPVYTKFQSMFWVFAAVLIIALLGLRCIEKGNKASKILGMVGLGFGVLGAIFQIILIWVPALLTSGSSFGLSIMAKITLTVAITTIVAIGGALIIRIKENEKMVKISKWIAIGSGIGIWLVLMILIFGSGIQGITKVLSLGSVLLSCFVVCLITALVLSHFNRNKKEIIEPETGIKEEVKVPEIEVKEEIREEVKVPEVEVRQEVAAEGVSVGPASNGTEFIQPSNDIKNQ